MEAYIPTFIQDMTYLLIQIIDAVIGPAAKIPLQGYEVKTGLGAPTLFQAYDLLEIPERTSPAVNEV